MGKLEEIEEGEIKGDVVGQYIQNRNGGQEFVNCVKLVVGCWKLRGETRGGPAGDGKSGEAPTGFFGCPFAGGSSG